MEENNSKEEMVYIPYGIKNRREFFEGFGFSEFKYTLISLPFAAAITFFTRVVLGHVLISSLSIVLIPIATVMLVVKDKCNLSVIGYLMIMLRFNWAKKYYPYKGEKWVM